MSLTLNQLDLFLAIAAAAILLVLVNLVIVPTVESTRKESTRKAAMAANFVLLFVGLLLSPVGMFCDYPVNYLVAFISLSLAVTPAVGLLLITRDF